MSNGLAGRPPALTEVNLGDLEKLCVLQCTQAEIAAYFGVTRRTIENYAQDPVYREVMERGKQKGLISIRRKQMELADAGNVTMLIWLGKQLLGQRDQMDHHVTEEIDIEIHDGRTARERIAQRLLSLVEPSSAA